MFSKPFSITSAHTCVQVHIFIQKVLTSAFIHANRKFKILLFCEANIFTFQLNEGKRNQTAPTSVRAPIAPTHIQRSRYSICTTGKSVVLHQVLRQKLDWNIAQCTHKVKTARKGTSLCNFFHTFNEELKMDLVSFTIRL